MTRDRLLCLKFNIPSDGSHHGRNVQRFLCEKEALDIDLHSIIAGPVLEVFRHAGSSYYVML